MRYCFLLNPAARGGRAGRQHARLLRALDAAGLDAEVHLTERPGHAAVLAARAAGRGYEAVVAVGGDGTAHEVARGLLHAADGQAPLPLGLVPYGTGDDFALAVQVPKRLEDAVCALPTAQHVPLDAGRVTWRSADGREDTDLFVNALGIGFDAAVAMAVGRYKRLPGLTAYLAALLQQLRRFDPPRATLALWETSEAEARILHDGPLLLATVGNGTRSGGGFLLTPHAHPADGLLDLCLIDGVSVPRILQLLPTTLWGGHVRHPEVREARGVALDLQAQAPLPVHADGEVLCRDAIAVRAEVLPGALTILQARGTM